MQTRQGSIEEVMAQPLWPNVSNVQYLNERNEPLARRQGKQLAAR